MKSLERWRDIIYYVGLYQVSDLGRVSSLDRVVTGPWGPCKLKGRILRPALSSSHLVVALYKDGIPTTKRVHQLVAQAWIGPCPDGMEVCHGPNGKLDNSVSNLRYDTRSNNALDCRRDGTHGGRPVRRSDGVEYINMRVAAEESGCNPGHICNVCRGISKTTGGYGWEYV